MEKNIEKAIEDIEKINKIIEEEYCIDNSFKNYYQFFN